MASYEYAAMNGLLTKQTYGNGDYVEFTYDILGRAKTTTYKDENGNTDRVLTYVYTGDSQLYSIHDSRTGFLYLYTYDSIGRLIGSSVKNSSGEVLMSTRQEYNANNQLVGQHWTVGTTTYSEAYTYSTTDGALTEYSNALGEDFTFNYDELRRLSSVVGSKYTKGYAYRDVSATNTTSQVSSLTYSGFTNAPSFTYSYDSLGNISRYTDPSGTQVYSYDAQNQLTKVKDADGNVLYQYSYDNAGNILSANGHSYAYSSGLWKDQLASFDGVAFEYDAIGNPTSYYNGTSYTFAWEEGRNLVSAVSGSNTYTYAYDSSGLRTSKTVNGVTHNYLYASGKLLRETYGNTTLDFVYDQSGHPYALIYKNGTASAQTYYYITNLQGDVLYLLDSEKQQVASYSYDPYGKHLDSATDGTIAAINPLRYRGYYYDAETGFYYLRSRYYDPATCRYINADWYTSTGQGNLGLNMHTYCLNNPVNYYDPNGNFCLAACYGTINLYNRDLSDYTGGGSTSYGYVTGGYYGNPGSITYGSTTIAVVGLSLSVGYTVGTQIEWPDYSDLKKLRDEVYAYSRELSQALINIRPSRPHVHHIVPVGYFLNRDPETIARIWEMHEMLAKAEINRFWDPMNLVLVSAKTHVSLHTDEYIDHVYSYLSATDGSKEQIYAMLFLLRLEIAAMDEYAIGY